MRNVPALILCVVSVVLYVLDVHSGLQTGAAWWTRMVYQCCHVNVFHLLVNMICVRSIVVSGYRVRWWMWMAAYAVSACAPAREVSTEGMSGIVYAMFGMMSWQAREKKRFHALVLAYLVAGWLMPGVNNMVHVWCYVWGMAIIPATKTQGTNNQTTETAGTKDRATKTRGTNKRQWIRRRRT